MMAESQPGQGLKGMKILGVFRSGFVEAWCTDESKIYKHFIKANIFKKKY
jgi:hypothetical protein